MEGQCNPRLADSQSIKKKKQDQRLGRPWWLECVWQSLEEKEIEFSRNLYRTLLE